MPDITVTLIQSNTVWEDIESNLARLDAAIDQIEGATDLIVLPEMFSTGFSMNAPALAETMNGKSVAWMRGKAKENKATIAGSLMIKENGYFFNRMIFAAPDGGLTTYDKKHLFAYAGEDNVYTAGRAHTSIFIKQWCIRPFICFDLRFPIWTRNLNLSYDIAVFTANWPARRSAHWRALLKARAIENQCYVIGVNRVGKDGNDLRYDGFSSVTAPTGEVLFELSAKEAIHSIRLSRDLLDDYRKEFPVWKDGDVDMII